MIGWAGWADGADLADLADGADWADGGGCVDCADSVIELMSRGVLRSGMTAAVGEWGGDGLDQQGRGRGGWCRSGRGAEPGQEASRLRSRSARPGDDAYRPDDATDRVSGVWHPLLRHRIAEAGAGAHLSEITDRGYRIGTRPRAGSSAGVKPGRDSLRSERSPHRRHPGPGLRVDLGTREHRTGRVGHYAIGVSAGEPGPDEAGPALAIGPLRSRATMTSRVDEFISSRPVGVVVGMVVTLGAFLSSGK